MPPALPLLCHPALPCPLAIALSAAWQWQAQGLALHFRLQGPLDRVLLPAPATPEPAAGLWRHTCFEAFVSPTAAAWYNEFNLSPSLRWAAYRFSAERQRDEAAEARAPLRPGLRFEHTTDQLDLWATLPEAALPPGPRLCIGLSAVIETHAGHLSYWALRHPRADRPDFHHRGGWLEVPRLPPHQKPTHP